MLNLKEQLKKNDVIRSTYYKANKKFVTFLVKNTPVLVSKYLYRRGTGKKLNLKNPLRNFLSFPRKRLCHNYLFRVQLTN